MRDLYHSSPEALTERAPQLAALLTEAETKVTALLGAHGFEAYRQYGGSWMQSLRLRPPHAGAPAPRR